MKGLTIFIMEKKNNLTPVWKTVEYSKNKIEAAGKTLGNPNSTDSEINSATIIVDNWREAHGYPLHVIYINLRRYAKENPSIIVAERLKRLESISKKLKRFPDMSLWRMQDLGGCRMIVDSIDDVYSNDPLAMMELQEKFEKKTYFNTHERLY